MFTQLCKQHSPVILFRLPIFTSKTYNHAVTYNHASADDNLQKNDVLRKKNYQLMMKLNDSEKYKEKKEKDKLKKCAERERKKFQLESLQTPSTSSQTTTARASSESSAFKYRSTKQRYAKKVKKYLPKSPVHKKGNKQILNNYRPVFLLPICSKLFEKIIFDTIFQHLMASKLLNPNQSGFMPGDSCIHQLISVIHEIYASFDAKPSLEVTGVFLDMSKAFDRNVWG